MVEVEVTEGLLEGDLVEDGYGGQYYSFKGIPYADPPVGDLRFKAPQPVKPWDGVRRAKEHGPVCYQIDQMHATVVGSEDCLYLNVYSPDIQTSSPLPVMVWIHGGAFISGSGDDIVYGPEFLVRHGVVVVTINYRLGLLGFLCLDTEDIPGNAGMKDQVLALKWVKNNIGSFGGDSDNITIFGESAGGISVGYHLISPMTKGLFNRAIAQSGSAANCIAHAFAPRDRALKLARQMGMYSEDDEDLYEFFKTLPVEKLVDFNLPAHLAKRGYEMDIGIVNEKDFGNEKYFYGEVYDALRNGIHEGVDVITGYNEDEGLWGLKVFKPEQMYKMSNDYNEFFVPRNLAYELSIKDQVEIGKEIKRHYFTNGFKAEDNCEGLIKYLGMEIFVHGVLTAAKFYANTGNNKVFVYKFTCKTERNQMANMFGVRELVTNRIPVCHADDIAYLFQPKLMPPVDENSDTFKLIDNITKVWTNFAKFGNPTPNDSVGVDWPQFTIEDQNYLEIGNEFVASSYPEKEDMELWDNTIKQYLPNHVV